MAEIRRYDQASGMSASGRVDFTDRVHEVVETAGHPAKTEPSKSGHFTAENAVGTSN